MKVLVVVGARPNFMKAAPIIRELENRNIWYKIVHTGQHYDLNMSDVFFEELNIPEPDINLGVGSGNHAAQTAYIMNAFDAVCEIERPDIVIVFGDINSTLACAMVVSKLKDIKLAHIEAGERSFDMDMPEEVNRIVTDVLSDYLFCATNKARNNLLSEGVDGSKIYVPGNVMIDNLLFWRHTINRYQSIPDYVLVTMHRASNADSVGNLEIVLSALQELVKDIPVFFPIHPRTRKSIKTFGLEHYLDNISVVEPLSYFKFVEKMIKSTMVITDSGGIQVETTVLDVPCLTIRENTEWDFTLGEGTNILVGVDKDVILVESRKIVSGDRKRKNLSAENAKLLDGAASKRIVETLLPN